MLCLDKDFKDLNALNCLSHKLRVFGRLRLLNKCNLRFEAWIRDQAFKFFPFKVLGN